MMKTKLRTLVCLLGVSVLPLFAGDAESGSASVEQRLREMDFSLTLRQYERVQMEAFETQLKLDLLSTDEGLTAEVRHARDELLAKRCEILRKRAHELRAAAQKLGEEMTVAASK